MSDTPKPWFMFGKDDDNNSSDDDELLERSNAAIAALEQRLLKRHQSLFEEDDEPDPDDETEYYEDPNCVDDITNDECMSEDKQFKYINEKLSVFPESSRILWSAVNLAIKKRRPIIADEYFKKLIAIPIKKHEFTIIISEIQYMLSEPSSRATQIRRYARFLQRKYPKREEGLFYEGILEEKLGNWDKSIGLFKSAVEKCKRAPKSAEHLVSVLLEAGEYEEVIKYAKLADMMSTSKKPVINMSELDFNLYLAKDSILRQRGINGENITTDDVDELRRSYEKLKIDHSDLKNDSELQNRINKLNSLRSELEK